MRVIILLIGLYLFAAQADAPAIAEEQECFTDACVCVTDCLDGAE